MMSGWFKFVQTKNGSIPAVFHNNEDDHASINFKRGIAAAFQANFEGIYQPKSRDRPTVSPYCKIHICTPFVCYDGIIYLRYEFSCRYEGSAQDEMDGVMKMHRRVTSKDVKDYSSHIPRDVVTLDQEEDINCVQERCSDSF